MLKLRLFSGVLLLILSTDTFSFAKKIDEIPAKDRKVLDQVRLEKGGQIMLEQYLNQKEKYNGQDAYQLVFMCARSKKAKIPECKIVKYEVLEKQLR